MDDPARPVIMAAVKAVEALLCSAVTRAVQDELLSSLSNLVTQPTRNYIPLGNLDDKDDKTDDDVDKGPDPKEDPDGQVYHITQSLKDVVQAMVDMDLLPRLRYLVEVAKMEDIYMSMLNIVIRCCHHSLQSCRAVVATPRLLDNVIAQWISPSADQFTAKAIKVLRLLSTASKELARLVCEHACFQTVLPYTLLDDLHGFDDDYKRAHSEAFRMLAVSLRYGFNADVIKEHYAVFVTMLTLQDVDYSTATAHHLVMQAALQLAPYPDLASPYHGLHWHNLQALASPLSASLVVADGPVPFAQLRLMALHASTLAVYLQAQRVANADNSEATLAAVAQAESICRERLVPLFASKPLATQIKLLAADLKLRAYTTCVPSNPHLLSRASGKDGYVSLLQRLGVVAACVQLLHACIQINRGLLGNDRVRDILFEALQPLLQAMASYRPALHANDHTLRARLRPVVELVYTIWHLRQLHNDWRRQTNADHSETNDASSQDGNDNFDNVDERAGLAMLLCVDVGQEDIAQSLIEQLIRGSTASPQLARVRVSLMHMLADGPLSNARTERAERLRKGVTSHGVMDAMLLPTRDADSLPLSVEWVFWPLRSLHSVAEHTRGLQLNASDSKVLLEDITGALKLVERLECHYPDYMGQLSPALHLRELMAVFTMPMDVYQDASVAKIMRSLLPVVTSAVLDANDPYEDQIKALLPTYHRAVEELASFSFGSKLFDDYLYIPLARTWPSEFRSALLTSEQALRQVTSDGNFLADRLEAYLSPLETSRPLLDLYIINLNKELLQPSSLVYKIAIHHVAAFFFQDFGDSTTTQQTVFEADSHAEAHRVHALVRSVLAMPDTIYNHMLGYTPTCMHHDLETSTLDPVETRLTMLKSLPVPEDKQSVYMQALQGRHPSLFVS
eukprot:TRINITY_DN5963_c0_g1_i1.p1 TRINITY_DN5963_c0_g1~~TRINITY_DN5963_c0_g1_i1.p1  ORF type:complete len:908 (+),score=214.28 TRINITY_DN5963_c0_g1_i1:3-2726(+)